MVEPHCLNFRIITTIFGVLWYHQIPSLSVPLDQVWVGLILFYPLTHFRSFWARSVTLTTLFLGKPPKQFTSTQLLFSSQWKRENGVEIFSRPSLHERMCRTWGLNSGLLACQANTLPIELPHPAHMPR